MDLASVSDPPLDLDAPPPDSEALRVLTAHAARREAGELAEALAKRALAVSSGADFAVARDALDALLRRLDSSRELVVRGAGSACYRVARRGTRAGGYDVWIAGTDASCSCLDYGKASLGLCKHALAVLARGVRTARRPWWPALRWDPVRPWTGPGDYLARLWLDRRGAASPRIRELFQTAPSACPIDPARLAEPAVRAATISRLLAACTRNPPLAEPAILPLLERERDALRRAHPALDDRALDRALRGMRRTLFPYQREGVARFLAAGRLLLADDMGLGKTAQAIAASHALFALGEIERVLIVVPAPLKPQWEREWRAFVDGRLIPSRSDG